jgi:hypothetical protein
MQDGWLASGLDPHAMAKRATWPLPASVELVDDMAMRVRWDFSVDKTEVRPEPGLLEGFIGLRSATPTRILAFARRWGALDLCQHGRPLPNPPPPPALWRCRHGDMPILAAEDELDQHGRLNPEPLEIWRGIAAQVWSIQSFADEAWQDFRARGRRPVTNGTDWREVHVVNAVNALLDEAAVRPLLWDFASGLRLDGWGLYGGIVVQLALSVAREVELRPCSTIGCSNPARPVRKGARPYCPECVARGERDRDRAARFRAANPGYYSSAARKARREKESAS